MIYQVQRDGTYFGSFSSYDSAVQYARSLEKPEITIDIVVCVAYINRDGEFTERPSFPKWKEALEGGRT